jgi:hypothetical protein
MIFKFLNHSSILISHGGYSILTDPWYVSNAFGNWYQYPAPRTKDIIELIRNQDRMAVLISHGHDDHLDDWFLKRHMESKKFICPKYPTPGLENRLKRIGSTETIDGGLDFGPFKLKQHINSDFTGYDAVVTIEYADNLIIHANDNWHSWPESTVRQINELTLLYDESKTFLLVQFGIADCFPMNYPQISTSECLKVIKARFQSYREGTLNNMTRLGLRHLYYYANQSRFDYDNKEINSLYDEAKRYTMNISCATQLNPGDCVLEGHNILAADGDNIDFFSFRMLQLENYVNTSYKKIVDINDFIPVKLLTDIADQRSDHINYIAPPTVWNRILIGDLNIESIIIGGAGVITKPNRNIRHQHMFMSKLSYVIQNRIINEGVLFFNSISTPPQP